MTAHDSGVLDHTDTIVAQATAAGRGALAIVRLSGSSAHAIGRAMIERWPDAPRVATLSPIHDQAGRRLDEALVIRYDAPASYTGEDAIEIVSHGGPVVPVTLIAAAIAAGARMAEPGEFTRRALLNGKMDVLQAEATADLVAARSRAAQRVALEQLEGGLSRHIGGLRERVLELEALIAYDIDFPEEDDGPIAPERVAAAVTQLHDHLSALLATARSGEIVREGAVVVLAGVPNAGKSSLFNALVGETRAIVTDIPGTTRDAIESVIDLPHWPVRLVDTAGLRETVDTVERLGVEVSESYLAKSDVVLACGANAAELRAAASQIERNSKAPVILAWTKCDLVTPEPRLLADLKTELRARDVISVSATTGAGLGGLLNCLDELLTNEAGPSDASAPLLTQERHRATVARALAEVESFRHALFQERLPATIAAVHLHEAGRCLEELIGVVDVENVLDEVFRRFCVGK